MTNIAASTPSSSSSIEQIVKRTNNLLNDNPQYGVIILKVNTEKVLLKRRHKAPDTILDSPSVNPHVRFVEFKAGILNWVFDHINANKCLKSTQNSPDHDDSVWTRSI